MGAKGGIFRFANSVDLVLMFFGVLGCVGDGLTIPLNMYVISGIFNEFGHVDISLSNEVVIKYSLRLVYVAIGVGVSAFVEGVCWTITAERQTSRIRKEFLKSVLRQEVGVFENKDSSTNTFQVVSTISVDANSIQDVIAEKIPNCLTHLCGFIACLVVSAILSWRMAVASLPFALGIIIPGVAFGKLLMNLGMKMNEAYSVAGSIPEQALSSIRTVYSYVGESQTVQRFSHALNESKNLGIRQGFLKGNLIGSMGMVHIAWAFQSWVGSLIVADGGESGGHVFISAVSLNFGGLSCMNALPNFTFITEATAAAMRIFELIDRIPQIDSRNDKGRVLESVRGEIEFKEVSFSYPSRPDITVLESFNLQVKAGEIVGIVGSSGSGKSTVISLLERFYDPITGVVLLDGHNIKELQLEWLRSQIGLVNQDPILFATSIKENILFGNENASMEEVIGAANSANAHDLIANLPDGYETQVGQFGFQLSGGQKQRIAIARALLRDPKILLLDEATSALDAESETMVQEAIEQAFEGRTTIIIAHRLSTIFKADNIVVLQSGKIVESGSHEVLMQRNGGKGSGIYFQMAQLQQSTTHNEASVNPYSTEERRQHRRLHTNTPESISIAASSREITPISPSSPAAVSPSIVPSIQSYSYHDSDSKDFSEPSCNPASPLTLLLLKMNAPEWKNALLGCLGAVTFGGLQPVHSYCLGSVVSVYLTNSGSKIKSEAGKYSFVFLSIGALTYFSNLLQHYNFAVMGEKLTKRVRIKMFQHLLSFEVGWFDQDKNTSAAICARILTQAKAVRTLVGDRMSLLVQVFVSITFAFLFALVITWRVAIVVIAIQPLAILCLFARSVLVKSTPKKILKAQGQGCQLASETVVNHRTITAFSSQERVLNLFAKTQESPRKESVKQAWILGTSMFCAQFVSISIIAMTFWYGGRVLLKGEVTTKHLFQAFFILMSTGKTIADAGNMTSDLARGSGAVSSVFEILDRKTEIEPEDPKGFEIRKTLKGKIELSNVFFAYPSRPDQMIFQGLNLRIEHGGTVALVGHSGSGKSTIIGLIERFYDPVKGVVFIDNGDIKNYNLRSLRSHIALVGQEPTVFAGTIQDNIAYGKENATRAEIEKAADLANAHEFVSSMKDGYETYCGERGVQLSGGQKQRIALARAILKDPAILLLDEATSALDSVSESLVQESLEKMMVGRTCVVIAHRLSTVQKSESIVVIKNGKAVEQGSHSELLALGHHGSYYSLVKLQHNLPKTKY